MEHLISSHNTAAKRAGSIRIYPDDYNFAEEVACRIASGKAITLLTSAPNSKTADFPASEDDDLQVTVTIITSLNAFYRFSSAYGPGAFLETAGGRELPVKTSDSVQLKALKIGICTGDVHFMITGTVFNVDDVSIEIPSEFGRSTNIELQILQFFIQKSQNGPPYTLSTLISRDYQLCNLKAVKCKIQQTPYGLIPGRLAKMSSTNIDELSSLLIQIAIDELIVPSTYVERILKFRIPPVTVKQDIDYIKLPETSSLTIPTSATINKQKLFKTVQLTKYEVTFLIGRNGKKIENIREKSGATIKVIPLNQHDLMTGALNFHDPMNKQFVRVSGTEAQIDIAVRFIEAEIYQFRNNGIVTY